MMYGLDDYKHLPRTRLNDVLPQRFRLDTDTDDSYWDGADSADGSAFVLRPSRGGQAHHRELSWWSASESAEWAYAEDGYLGGIAS